MDPEVYKVGVRFPKSHSQDLVELVLRLSLVLNPKATLFSFAPSGSSEGDLEIQENSEADGNEPMERLPCVWNYFLLRLLAQFWRHFMVLFT